MKFSQSAAEIEGHYRLIRNPDVLPEAITEADFTGTAIAAQIHSLLMAFEDITTHPKTRGLFAPSVLLYAPDTAQTIGLIDQQRWNCEKSGYGKKHL